jgi:hypothetical protein
MTSNIFANANLQAHYDACGFAKASILSHQEVEQLLAEISSLQPSDSIENRESKRTSLPYHVSFLDSNQDYRRRVFHLVESYFSQKIRYVLPDYQILNTSLVIKPAGSGMFEVHHDWSFVADHAIKCMTVWCPLVDTSILNGTIHVLPGSNQLIQEYQAPKLPCYFEDFRESLIDRWLQPIPTQAGDALFWDNHMIHWSGNNYTQIPRVAVQITCIPAQSQPVFIFYDERTPEHFEIIEADREFWLTTDHHQLFTRQSHWRSLGCIPNENRRITEAEFRELLQARTR